LGKGVDLNIPKAKYFYYYYYYFYHHHHYYYYYYYYYYYTSGCPYTVTLEREDWWLVIVLKSKELWLSQT